MRNQTKCVSSPRRPKPAQRGRVSGLPPQHSRGGGGVGKQGVGVMTNEEGEVWT